MELQFSNMLTSNMSRFFAMHFYFYNIYSPSSHHLYIIHFSSTVCTSVCTSTVCSLNESNSHVLDRSGQFCDVKQHCSLTSLADIIIMYIFYIMYVIVFNCCRVTPLIATCVYVLKGVSLTILYLYILVK